MVQAATSGINNGTVAHRLLSDLPASIFDNLISTPRANNDANDNLRQKILSKLFSHAAEHQGNDKAEMTVRELLKISESLLLRILDPLLTAVESRRLMTRVYHVCAVTQPRSALQITLSSSSTKHNHNSNNAADASPQFSDKIPTGLSSIDKYLFGGFATGSVTEVVGRAGVGKTHLALQLCVLAAVARGGGAIFIDTENKLSLDRLNEIAVNRNRNRRGKSSSKTSYSSSSISSSRSRTNPVDIAQLVLENVTVRSFFSTKELLETLDELRLEITQRNTEAGSQKRLPVRLLVIDSIAAPIRRDFDMTIKSSSDSHSSSAAQRTAALLHIASKLKALASDFNLAVIVVNQVGVGSGSSSNQLGGDYQRNDTLDIRDGEFTASLGTAWQYCVSTRIILEHDDDPHKQSHHHYGNVAKRTATIAKSLISRRAKVEFQVTDEGLCELFS